jgi:uncharacterized protein (TIGR02246 family)
MSATQEGTLAARVRRLEDLHEIHTLFMAYGHALDAKDWEPYAELFTEDTEFSANIGTVHGREAVRDLFAARLRDVDPGRHVFTNIDIALDAEDPDRATARSQWANVHPRPEDGLPTIMQFGHYDDVLVRRDGRWLFAERHVTRDLGFPPTYSA